MDNYLANPNLKRAHVPIGFTSEQVEEVIKCSQDVVYFIKNYVKIINLDEGLVPFNMYPFQEDMANTISDNRFTVIKTCRQAGKTTTSAAVILWHVLFNESYTIAILANKLNTAREILSRVQRAYENLPKWLQQGVVVWNKTNIELENGSQIIASSTASSAIRGYSINFLYLDEFAFVPRTIQDDFFTSVYPTIISGSNTKVVITSTPNGFDLFYKIWINSVEGRNEYQNFMVNWWDVPGRDEEWRQKTIANTSEDQFRQEFDAEFLGSANTLISPNILKILAFIDPLSKHYDSALSVYEEPQPGRNYFIVADVSRGVGVDASAFLVYDVTEMPYKVVAAYKNNLIEPILYPEIIYQVAKSYGEAFVMIEINDNGQQIADILHQDLEYENIVYTTVKGRAGQIMGAGFAQNTQRGVRTTKQVKRLGCVNMKTMIEKQQIILNDFHVINELSTFIHKGNGYEAESGAHDDLVMCIVLLAWATTQTFFKELTDTDFRAKILAEREKMWEDEVLPFAFYDDGQTEENEVNINNYGESWVHEDSLNKW
tara:strand:- start:95 stop:1726 length:1632 start_codon:yes stop_codon:yes gene_type:complete